jgi:aspartate racemase
MHKVGIIGGIGPSSTLDYYTGIIEGYRAIKQDNQYPELVINSINMTKMLGFLEQEDWDGLVSALLTAVNQLQSAGATFAAIASNTPHIVYSRLKEVSPIPLISIVEATCDYAKSIGCKKVVILGTKFTMSNGLYTNIFPSYDMKAYVPDTAGIDAIHSIIFPNLENGIVNPDDKKKMLLIASKLIKEHNADGLVLGCTELPLMIQEDDLPIKVLNTTKIHIAAILKYMTQQ